MQVKDLQLKRVLRTALLVLLLSAVGMGKMYAQSFTVGDLSYSVNSDGVSVTVTGHVDGTAATGSLTIPEAVTYEGTDYSITMIGNSAFYNCTGLTGSLTIPNSVTSIGRYAFYNCTDLTGSLTIPNSVVSIGNDAFDGCSGFTGVYYTGDISQWCIISFDSWMANPLYYAHNLYVNNELVTDLVIPDNVTEVHSFAFVWATCLTSLTISNSVTTIGNVAFYGCSGISCISIPNSVQSIGRSAFSETGWYNVQANGILYLDDWCLGYKGEKPVGTLVLEGNTRGIAGGAFQSCNELTGSLVIPGSVIAIGEGAFSSCSGFSGDLVIPNSVTTIGGSAFNGCSGFTGNLTIGNSVNTIGNWAFSGCRGFFSIINLAEAPPSLGNDVFNNVFWNTGIPVLVPCGSEEDYSSLSWGGFRNFIEMCGGMVTVVSNPEEGGMVTGEGVFEDGQTCTVMATANEDYTFVNWTVNGAIVSTNAEYTFYVTGDMTLVAHFASEDNIVFADANVKDICVSHWDTNGDGELSYAEAALVTDLGNYFQSNTQITSFDELQYFIGLSSIGVMAFFNCSNLSGNLFIPSSVTTIGSDAFYNCSGFIGDLVIPNAVTTIDAAAFSYCSGFTGNLTIPSSVTTIGSDAFYNCSGFTGDLVIPNSVTTIGYGAFRNCSGFTGSLTIPNSVTSIGWGVFSGCSFNGLDIDISNIPDSFISNIRCTFSGPLTIGNSVTTIGNYAFDGCSGFTGSLTIGNSVTTIGHGAFRNCSGFTGSLTIGNSVTTIGNAFESCSNFTSVYYTGGIDQWCNISFSNWSSNPLCYAHNLYVNNELVTDLVIPESVTEIKAYAFYWATCLLSLTIPNSVTSIESGAFCGCSGFTGELTIGNSVTSIGNSAFSHCSGFTGSLTIPNSVTTIGPYAFENCSGLTGSLTIGNSVTTIGTNAFYNCSGFTGSLVIPNSVTSIESGAFYGCSGFAGDLTIGNSVTTIGTNAFYNCSGLTGSLTIPNSVTSISNGAFSGCSGFMGGLTIPNSVTTIGQGAFSGCSGFNSITSLAETPPSLGNNVFVYNANTPIYVPCGFEETYSSISWGGFSNFYGLCSGMVTVSVDPEDGGMVTGGGSFEGGSLCTVTTLANEGFTFINWTANGAIVSTNAEYTFYVTGDVALVAHFVPEGNIVFADANVKNICVSHWDTNGDGELSYLEAAMVSDLENGFRYNTNITSFDELQYFIGLSSIGSYTFWDCGGLTSIVLPNSVTMIGDGAFGWCSGLTGDLIIPNSVTTIGSNAFYNCSGFTGDLVIPNSVTTISNGAFTGCSGFEVIEVEESNMIYDSRENCNAIIISNTNELVFGCKNTIIPNSVTAIGGGAFRECIGLTGSLIIPNSVTTIGYNAFAGCSNLLETIMLSETPPTLGRGAFDMEVNMGKNVFEETGYPIYVPYESLNTYKISENWNYYEDRIFSMTYETISGYGEGEGNWHFIASPLLANTAPTAVNNMITETEYDLYRFNQSATLEWENYKAHTVDFELVNGQGYLYANAEDVNLIFKGAFNEDETKEVSLAYDANATFAGWNLVGNPFPVSAYANKSYYTMNEDGTGIEPVAVSSAMAIAPCTGVMVVAEGIEESVTFSKTAPEMAANQGNVQVAVAENTLNRDGIATVSKPLWDKAIVSFNMGDQLEKFVFNKGNANLSIPQGGKDFAIICTEKQGEMPLNFKAAKNGSYMLSVNAENAELEYLHLIDNLTGADVDLLATPSYIFEAKTSDYASRFRLVFNANETDGPSTGSGTFAFISNGNIIVTGVEADAVLQIVDEMGRVLVSYKGDAMNRVSTGGMTPGVYVLRLIQGENMKTQKIVVW